MRNLSCSSLFEPGSSCLVLAGVGLDLGTVQTHIPEMQHTQGPRHHQDLEQASQVPNKPRNVAAGSPLRSGRQLTHTSPAPACGLRRSRSHSRRTAAKAASQDDRLACRRDYSQRSTRSDRAAPQYRPRNAPNDLPASPAATAAKATRLTIRPGNPATSADLFHNLQLLEHYILILQWLPGQDGQETTTLRPATGCGKAETRPCRGPLDSLLGRSASWPTGCIGLMYCGYLSFLHCWCGHARGG